MPKFVLRFNSKDINKYIIWALLCWILFNGFLIDVIKAPSMIRYIADALNIVLFVSVIARLKWFRTLNKSTKNLCLLIGAFILLSFLFWLVDPGDPLLLFWGARNTFRFLIFFVACIFFLDTKTIEKMLGKINGLLIINFLLCIFEFVFLGFSGDYIGGGFGTSTGVNAPLNGLLVIATVYNIVSYTNKRSTLFKSAIYLVVCAAIAGMAELKVYIVEILLITIIVSLFSKSFSKIFLIVIIGLITALTSIKLIETLIPGWEGFFTLKNMLDMVSSTEGYTNSGDLNRLTSISKLNEIFFSDSINWIGFGLGNCEYSSSFSFLNSEFSLRYGYLHYAWFSVAKIYLELGWFGIGCHISIWLYTLYSAVKKLGSYPKYKSMVSIMAVMAVFFFFYNFTMNLDAAYLIYAVLSFVYVNLEFSQKEGINTTD